MAHRFQPHASQNELANAAYSLHSLGTQVSDLDVGNWNYTIRRPNQMINVPDSA